MRSPKFLISSAACVAWVIGANNPPALRAASSAGLRPNSPKSLKRIKLTVVLSGYVVLHARSMSCNSWRCVGVSTLALNIDAPVPTPEEAARHPYTPEERRYVAGQRARAVIGGPPKVRREIEAMAERYGADEVMVLTITGDYASRTRSYERLIGAF